MNIYARILDTQVLEGRDPKSKMSFTVWLESNDGSIRKILDDPRGHLGLIIIIARRLGYAILPSLDPYADHIITGEQAQALASELEKLALALTPEVLSYAKNEMFDFWNSFGVFSSVEGQGYQEHLDIATITLIERVVTELAALARVGATKPNVWLALYGD